ncbi:MAG: hypothetical protein ACRC9T_06000, partial [Vibrionaceae bacterium]
NHPAYWQMVQRIIPEMPSLFITVPDDASAPEIVLSPEQQPQHHHLLEHLQIGEQDGAARYARPDTGNSERFHDTLALLMMFDYITLDDCWDIIDRFAQNFADGVEGSFEIAGRTALLNETITLTQPSWWRDVLSFSNRYSLMRFDPATNTFYFDPETENMEIQTALMNAIQNMAPRQARLTYLRENGPLGPIADRIAGNEPYLTEAEYQLAVNVIDADMESPAQHFTRTRNPNSQNGVNNP